MNEKEAGSRPRVKITKEFSVPPEKVFDAWLDTGMLSQWMFGPRVREETIVSLKNKSREDGTFSYKVLRNGDEINHTGTYRKIERPQNLVFTWGVDEEAGDESVVTIRIEPTDQGCKLTLLHELDPKWEEYVERTREGWNHMLEFLKRTVNEAPV